MKKLLKIELAKAFKNKAFYLAVFLGTAITALSLIYCVSIYKHDIKTVNQTSQVRGVEYNPDAPMHTLFNRWVGGEGGSLGYSVYFFVFPLLCAIPYGWSYCVEKKSGYMKSIVVRSGKRAYFTAKYIATFLSGGAAMVLPMIINILATACFFPAVKPVVTYDIYYGVFKKSLMAELYYSKPFLYLVYYLIIDFIYCGILTCLCMAVVTVIRQKYVVILIPFLVCMGMQLIERVTYDTSNLNNRSMSPFDFLSPIGIGYQASFPIIVGTAVILSLITYFCIYIWECKHEIY